MCAAFEVAAKSCDMFLEKNAEIKFWRITFSWINIFSRFLFTGNLQDARHQKNIKSLKFDWKWDVYENSKNCIFYKITQDLDIVLKINPGQKDEPFITIIGKSVSCGTT